MPLVLLNKSRGDGVLVFCRDCGSEISEKAVVCPKCGIQQRPITAKKYCSDCGALISEKALLCPKCGVRQRGFSDLNPGLVAILELMLGFFGFLGIGHMYSHHFWRGVCL
jgi:RNA polymerase subunit RPABC4/transcription elongation factor Spt4